MSLDGTSTVTKSDPHAWGTQARQRFTTRDGTTLRVWEEGPEDAPATVVLIHGWTLTAHTWDRVVPALPDTAGPVRVLRYDLRGHGDSDPSPAGTATIAQCADDLAELLEQRVPHGPVILAGHSMGGMTIMALAERHRALLDERVTAVALISTSSGRLANPTFGLPKPLARAINGGERMVRRQLASARRPAVSLYPGVLLPGLRWLLFGEHPQRQDLKASAAWVAACHPPSMAGFRESLAEHERTEVLERLRGLPTVILAGLSDRLTPHGHARRIAGAMPEARLLTYPGAGHMLPLERTGEVTARIADLVRQAR